MLVLPAALTICIKRLQLLPEFSSGHHIPLFFCPSTNHWLSISYPFFTEPTATEGCETAETSFPIRESLSHPGSAPFGWLHHTGWTACLPHKESQHWEGVSQSPETTTTPLLSSRWEPLIIKDLLNPLRRTTIKNSRGECKEWFVSAKFVTDWITTSYNQYSQAATLPLYKAFLLLQPYIYLSPTSPTSNQLISPSWPTSTLHGSLPAAQNFLQLVLRGWLTPSLPATGGLEQHVTALICTSSSQCL